MKKKKTLVIGVTGGIGMGKSTISAMFKEFGAKILDADKIAHLSMKKGTKAYKKIRKVFGGGILAVSGEIKREELAKLVFKDKDLLSKLCAIVHPEVVKYVERYLTRAFKSARIHTVVIDAPLLIEAGMREMTDILIVVKTSIKTQIKRCQKEMSLNILELKARARNQMPLGKKLSMADYVINNEGNRKDAERMVKKIWEEIKSGRK